MRPWSPSRWRTSSAPWTRPRPPAGVPSQRPACSPPYPLPRRDVSPMTEELVQKALDGDRRALPRLFTLLERDPLSCGEIMKSIHPLTGRAHCVGCYGTARRRQEHSGRRAGAPVPGSGRDRGRVGRRSHQPVHGRRRPGRPCQDEAPLPRRGRLHTQHRHTGVARRTLPWGLRRRRAYSTPSAWT